MIEIEENDELINLKLTISIRDENFIEDMWLAREELKKIKVALDTLEEEHIKE